MNTTASADQKLATSLKIHGAGARRVAVKDVAFDEAAAEFGLKHEDFEVPVPAAIKAKLDDIKGTPTGKFSGRTSAESRAMALDRKLPKGTTIYAQQVGDHWCVIKASAAGREILEG